VEEEYALRKTRRGVRAKKKTKLLERAGSERLGSPGWPTQGERR